MLCKRCFKLSMNYAKSLSYDFIEKMCYIYKVFKYRLAECIPELATVIVHLMFAVEFAKDDDIGVLV